MPVGDLGLALLSYWKMWPTVAGTMDGLTILRSERLNFDSDRKLDEFVPLPPTELLQHPMTESLTLLEGSGFFNASSRVVTLSTEGREQ